MKKPNDGLYIMLISVHGLIRGHDLELGRDADTGGQTKYVVELARALGKHADVARVDLITRQVIDLKVDADYQQPVEKISKNVSIIRLPCGPRRYLRKEVLWPYLDNFVDNILPHIRKVGRIPDVVHSHYADAGYVGTRLVQLMGLPLVFTGHSLGRVKKQRLLEKGSKPETIEAQYNIALRIEAEEIALGNANLVVTSTKQEVQEQYELYDNYHPRRMMVIPPGVDLSRFYPQPASELEKSSIRLQLNRFLKNPDLPMILTICRPDERKNVAALIKAYGEHKKLQEKANLVLVLGNRDDINRMDRGSREVLNNVLQLIDKYDLYGKVAYPKHHEPEDVADLYRMAAISKGVFVNPAFTEPFGLTLIEAAASGVPLVATHDGGPKEIISTCDNGILVDPLQIDDIANALISILSNKTQWEKMSKSGIEGAHQHFSWESHISKYVKSVQNVVSKSRRVTDVSRARKNRLPTVDRLLVCDIDNTLLGDSDALASLIETLAQSKGRVGFGVATGRQIDSTIKILKEWGAPEPDLFITSVGSEIHYGHRMVEDDLWRRHIEYRWQPNEVKKIVKKFPGLKLQSATEQRAHKISFDVNPRKMPSIREISAKLRQHDLHVKLIYSHEAYLDVLPIRASKGLALRHIAIKWGIEPERILVAGDSGNDEEMLKGNTLGVVVGNYSKELNKLKGRERIYFADGCYAWGVVEGLQYYGFMENVIPKPDNDEGVFQDDYAAENVT